MLPCNPGGHAAYQDTFLSIFLKFYPDSFVLPKSAWDYIVQFWHLDLSFKNGLIDPDHLALADDGTPVQAAAQQSKKRICDCKEKGCFCDHFCSRRNTAEPDISLPMTIQDYSLRFREVIIFLYAPHLFLCFQYIMPSVFLQFLFFLSRIAAALLLHKHKKLLYNYQCY